MASNIETSALRDLPGPAEPIEEIDNGVRQLAKAMLETMYQTSSGVGLAAPQLGVQRRLFVYDIGDGPGVVVNPVLNDCREEWTYGEGCLSLPELHWPIVRAKQVRLMGTDLSGNPMSIEADELLARCSSMRWTIWTACF